MKICINTDKLTDAPFVEGCTFPFYFDEGEISEIVNDLKNGTPTCYLISGYRGAGKSSFVRRVESKAKDDTGSILFVHVNFTKYKSQSYLLRKLIRAIYHALSDPQNELVLNNLKTKDANTAKEKQTWVLLERLYDQTFHEVTDSYQDLEEKSKGRRIEFDYLLFGSFLLAAVVSISNFFNQWITDNQSLSIITLIISLIGTLKEALSIKSFRESKKVFTKDFQRKSLYDDEISDFHLNTLFDKFKAHGIKLVFVLDELDKVKTEEVDPLINEMKPYLVSGKASFIVVAGQDLFYKYESEQSKDDAVLSTLFSRVIHVPLLSIDAFHNIFSELVNTNSGPQLNPADYRLFVDHLIYQSKRVPRRFVNLIREKVNWQDNRSIIIDENSPKFKADSEIVNAIKKIDETEVAVKLVGAARDYVIMQLFLKCDRIQAKGFDDLAFTKEDIDLKEQSSPSDKTFGTK